MPKLFSPKDMQHTPLIPSSMPTAVPAPPKKPSNKKKILLAAGIIVVILIAAVAAFVILPKMGLLGAHGSGVSVVAATTTTIPVTTPASGTRYNSRNRYCSDNSAEHPIDRHRHQCQLHWGFQRLL